MNTRMNYLRKYIRNPELISLSDINKDLIPDYWANALAHEGQERVSLIVEAWKPFEPQLPMVFDFLSKHLQDVQIMSDGLSIRLLYELERDGNTMYYVGGNPESKVLTSEMKLIWNSIPNQLRSFYDKLHNGWYYLASDSMGPSPVEHWFRLNEQDWGILDDIDDPGCDLSNLIAVYSNSMGSYVALNVKHLGDYGDVIWWKDRAPTKNIDLWGVIDAWSEIGLNN